MIIKAIPDANQTFREITFEVIAKKVENDIHPRAVLLASSPAGCCT